MASKRIKYSEKKDPWKYKTCTLRPYKTMMKEIKDRLNKWMTSHVHGLEKDLILLKW